MYFLFLSSDNTTQRLYAVSFCETLLKPSHIKTTAVLWFQLYVKWWQKKDVCRHTMSALFFVVYLLIFFIYLNCQIYLNITKLTHCHKPLIKVTATMRKSLYLVTKYPNSQHWCLSYTCENVCFYVVCWVSFQNTYKSGMFYI